MVRTEHLSSSQTSKYTLYSRGLPAVIKHLHHSQLLLDMYFYLFLKMCLFLIMFVSACVLRRTVRRRSVLSPCRRWSWPSRSLCWTTSSSGVFLTSQYSHDNCHTLIRIRQNTTHSPLWMLLMMRAVNHHSFPQQLHQKVCFYKDSEAKLMASQLYNSEFSLYITFLKHL